MSSLPWSTMEVNTNELLEEEIKRQLLIMRTAEPDSDEYAEAMTRYNDLHEHSLKEKQLKESKRARWFDAITTGALAGFTLTAESWTPITSRWMNSVMHPFKSKRDKLNL